MHPNQLPLSQVRWSMRGLGMCEGIDKHVPQRMKSYTNDHNTSLSGDPPREEASKIVETNLLLH
jgi:hypothetical protein